MSIPQGYHIKKRKKKGFNPINCLLISVFVTAGIVGSAFIFVQSWYVRGISTPNSKDSTIVSIEIQQGLNSEQIGKLLYENNLIKDTNLWNFYLKINGLSPSLLADKYQLPKNLTIEEVVDTISRPQEKQIIWVTFPEGINYKQMGVVLTDLEPRFTSGFNVSEFLRISEFPDNTQFKDEEVLTFLDTYKPKGVSLEGFLYPNTYALEPDMTTTDVVEFILKEFITQVEHLDLDNGKLEFYDALILASVVEHESLDTDREIIAGIFNNRLNLGMKLQSDATVNYATGKNDRRATYEDLENNSPYNTYKFPGLPPTPIASPRIESIEASLNPIETEYLYFIHEPDGTPHFGKTLDEHNYNVNTYLDN